MSICLAVVVLVLVALLAKARGPADNSSINNYPTFNTPFQAVLLDNGQVFYGKIAKLGTAFPKMTDVYYIVNREDPKTKQIKHVLIRRGKELHAPTETFLDARHIIMIEPVGPNSEVARLIAQYQLEQH